MRVSICKECELLFDSSNQGHFCPELGRLVFEEYTIDRALNKWKWMSEKEQIEVWDTNYSTIYSSKPAFSYAWTFESFCKAPNHMIARAVNLYCSDLWLECVDYDSCSAKYRPFSLFDYKGIIERSRDIDKENNEAERLERILESYRKQEEDRLYLLQDLAWE